ncbi:MAG TPA: histidine phosphatase family protein [Patescibacteria group bacterium]|nr:histidine phosphatase family protein [Patescibacteria group bacterium]
MTLYIVRHGESEGNAARVHQTNEMPLSPSGLSQAKKVAGRFLHTPVDLIISSTAMRAEQTAKEISAAVSKEIEFNEKLIEKQGPSETAGKKHIDVHHIWKAIAKHSDDPDWHYSNEENTWDFIKRIAQQLRQIEMRNQENIVLVSHGHVIRALLGLMLFGPEFSSRQFDLLVEGLQTTNTGITVCSYREDKRWEILTFNDHAHLLE